MQKTRLSVTDSVEWMGVGKREDRLLVTTVY